MLDFESADFKENPRRIITDLIEDIEIPEKLEKEINRILSEFNGDWTALRVLLVQELQENLQQDLSNRVDLLWNTSNKVGSIHFMYDPSQSDASHGLSAFEAWVLLERNGIREYGFGIQHIHQDGDASNYANKLFFLYADPLDHTVINSIELTEYSSFAKSKRVS